jgi:peptide deformylase
MTLKVAIKGAFQSGPLIRMKSMDLVLFPDHRLREICEPVSEVNDEVRDIISEMKDNMKKWGGIGLAAPQCGIMKRMFVALIANDITQAFINPTFEAIGEDEIFMEEGCLSMPGVAMELPRLSSIHVYATNENNESFEMKCDGILARCVQHEIDHLDGVLMIDHLEMLRYRFAVHKIWKARIKSRSAR